MTLETKRRRSKGGYLSHILPIDSRTALCGYKPKGNSSRVMKDRSGWWSSDRGAWYECKKCNAALEKMKVPS